MEASKHPATRRYPPELRERAVRMVFEAIEHNGERHGVITRVAAQLGVRAESLRTWVRQSEVDSSHEPGRRPRRSCASRSWSAPSACVATMVETQRALGAHPWPAEVRDPPDQIGARDSASRSRLHRTSSSL